MCFDYDALPPEIPLATLAALYASGTTPGIATSQQIELTSQDGTQFAAYVARPAAPRGAGIVILPDARGLYHFYEELAERFAAAGVEAIVIDYFGRTAGAVKRDDQFDFMSHIRQVKPEQVAQDVSAAIAQLKHQAGDALHAIFTVGFCFGGIHSLLHAANNQGLAGVIGFYGAPVASHFGDKAPIDRISEFSCPVEAFYGGADQGIPVADVQQFDAALAQAGIEHEVIIYADAPHSFFGKSSAQFQEASADAWRHSLAFIDAHTPLATV